MHECGVYKFVFSMTQQVIYIGKTEDSFKNRIDAHFRGKGLDSKFLPYIRGGCEVYIHRMANNAEKSLVSDLETALINLYKPVLNKVNKCEGLSLYLAPEKIDWERWETHSFPESKMISTGMVRNTASEEVKINDSKCSSSHTNDSEIINKQKEVCEDLKIKAVIANRNDGSEIQVYHSDLIDYPGLQVYYDIGGTVQIKMDKCRITFSGWRYDLNKLRDVLQKLWKDWEIYMGHVNTNGNRKVIPHISDYPECLYVALTRGGTYAMRIAENDYNSDGMIVFHKEAVWKSLKILDIVLEDAGDKIAKIKKLFKGEYTVSQLVYKPWSEIAYLEKGKCGNYVISIEGHEITFISGFTGTIPDLKQIVDRAWDVCNKENKKYITSKELPDMLEFPLEMHLEMHLQMYFENRKSYGFDVVTYDNKEGRIETVVGIEGIMKLKVVLDILTDDGICKISRMVSYLDSLLGKKSST